MKDVTVGEVTQQLKVCHAALLKQLIKKKRLNRATRRIAAEYRGVVRWLAELERIDRGGGK